MDLWLQILQIYGLGMNLIASPIKGFPDTYNNKGVWNNTLWRDFFTDSGQPYIQLKAILNDRKIRNIDIYGFFQRYEYLAPYKEKIVNEWLRMDTPIMPYPNKNAIVLHIRLNVSSIFYLPFEYYEGILNSTIWDEVVICSDWPDHPYIQKFMKYSPRVIKHKDPYSYEATIGDFRLIASFNKIVISQSTFSWWAAFLSKATEIYMPKPKYGYMSDPDFSNISLQIYDNPIYRIIDCDNTLNEQYWSWQDPKI